MQILPEMPEGLHPQRAAGGQQGKKDNRLRIIIACSDGYPDDEAGVQLLAEKFGKLNAVTVGVGMTETAVAVEQIFATEYSRGDLARDLNDLPLIVAKHVILESIKLFPEKAKANAKNVIEGYLKKFKIAESRNNPGLNIGEKDAKISR